jgi:drug/metabolite transporter (DMT)-like permease
MSLAAPTADGSHFAAIVNKLIATVFFAAMGAMIKHLAERYPVGQNLFCRSLFAMIPVLWLVHRAGGPQVLWTAHPMLHLRRSISGVGSMACGFAALALLPLATATAIGFAAPIFITILAIPLLGEKVRIYRWSAVAIGFVGVLLIVGPLEGGLSTGTAFALGGAVMTALAMISIRRMADTENGLAIVFYFTLTCTVVGALSLPFAARLPIDALDAAIMVAAGLFGGLGQVFQTRAYAQAPASLVASLDYTALIFALAIGWAVWGETMGPLELLGAAIVIASALFIAYRERRRHGEGPSDRVAGT